MNTKDPVPARSNAFGSHELPGGIAYVREGDSEGYTTWYDFCSREYPSNNPIRVLATGGKWRDPQRYRRFIRRFSKVESSGIPFYGFYPVYRIPGGNKDGLYLLTCLDGWWGVTHFDLHPNVEAEATTEALARIGERKVSLGTALGESKRTFSHLAGTVVSVLKAFQAARRGNWNGVARALGVTNSKVASGRSAAERWLEYQYGWKPLLSELYSGYKTMQEGLSESLFVHSKGFGETKLLGETYFYDDPHKVGYSVKWDATQICSVKLTGELVSSAWHNASQLDLVNPLTVAWELVPFSFIVDWFMPIGNMLEALTARAGLNFVGGTKTVVTRGMKSLEAIHSPWGFYQTGGVTVDVYGLDRNPYYDWPLPMLYVDESPFSETRTLNALALWRSTIKGV